MFKTTQLIIAAACLYSSFFPLSIGASNISAIQLLLLDDENTSRRDLLPPGYKFLPGKGNTNISGSGNGNEYWVDINNPQASDNGPGTESKPWKTFKHAVQTVVAGDTVNVMPGVYVDNESFDTGQFWKSFSPNHSGQLGNPITFRSVVPRAAILKSSASQSEVATRDKALAFYGRNDIIFDGFKAIGLVHFNGSERISFINGEVTMGSTPWDDPSLLWGIAVEVSHNCVIRNNLVHSMAPAFKNGNKLVMHNQAGIMVFGGGGPSTNNLIEYNEIDLRGKNGSVNVYGGLGNKGGNLVGNVWRNNFIQNSEAGIFSQGSTISGLHTVEQSQYLNNIVINSKYGVEFSNSTNDAIVSNNTLSNLSEGGLRITAFDSENISFINNIITKTESPIYVSGYYGGPNDEACDHKLNSTFPDYCYLSIFKRIDYNLYDQYSGNFFTWAAGKIKLKFSEIQVKQFETSSSVGNPSFVNSSGLTPESYKRTIYPRDGAGGSLPFVKGAYTSRQDVIGNY